MNEYEVQSLSLMERIASALETISINFIPEGEGDGVVISCPHCAEVDEDKIMDTSTGDGFRFTCLSCGKSFPGICPV